MKKTHKVSNNIFYLKVFFLIFFLTMLLSLVLKTVHLVRSSSLSQDSYSILLIGDSTRLYRVSGSSQKVGVVNIIGIDGKKITNRLEGSILVESPVNAMIIDTKSGKLPQDYFSLSNVLRILSNGKKDKLLGMNGFDLLKVSYMISRTPKENFKEVTTTYKQINENGRLGQEIYDVIKDESVINRKLSVEVVNATNINGLGAKISSSLESIGYNVVSISSSGNYSKSEIIYSMIPEEYARSLSQAFELPYRLSEKQIIADIRLIVTEDKKIMMLEKLLQD